MLIVTENFHRRGSLLRYLTPFDNEILLQRTEAILFSKIRRKDAVQIELFALSDGGYTYTAYIPEDLDKNETKEKLDKVSCDRLLEISKQLKSLKFMLNLKTLSPITYDDFSSTITPNKNHIFRFKDEYNCVFCFHIAETILPEEELSLWLNMFLQTRAANLVSFSNRTRVGIAISLCVSNKDIKIVNCSNSLLHTSTSNNGNIGIPQLNFERFYKLNIKSIEKFFKKEGKNQ